MKKEYLSFAKYMVSLPVNDDGAFEVGKNDFNSYSFVIPKGSPSNDFSSYKTYADAVLKRIAAVVSDNTSQKRIVLLLSGGKDSLSIALALSEFGVPFETITFLRDEDSKLKSYLEKVTFKMRIKSTFISTREISDRFDYHEFKESFHFASYPMMDQAYLFYYFGLKLFIEHSADENFINDFCFIDGMGNDEYFGHLPTKKQQQSFALSKMGFYKLVKSGFHRYYLRSPSESQGLLSGLSYFFEIKVESNIEKYFSYAVSCIKSEHDFLSFRAFSRGQYLDKVQMAYKIKLASTALGMSCFLPWEDESLQSLVVRLPLSFKFDLKEGRNKVLLRNILTDKLAWSQDKRGIDLFVDLSVNDLRDFSKDVPDVLSDRIFKAKLASFDLKKRAILELVNFYAFCTTHGVNDHDFIKAFGLK